MCFRWVKSLWCSFAARRIRKARKRDLRSSRSRNQLLRNLRFRRISCAACARTCLQMQSWSHAVGTLSVMNVSAVVALNLFPKQCVQCVRGLPSYCCLLKSYCIWHGTLTHSVLSWFPVTSVCRFSCLQIDTKGKGSGVGAILDPPPNSVVQSSS
jgi:hypothetical protein